MAARASVTPLMSRHRVPLRRLSAVLPPLGACLVALSAIAAPLRAQLSPEPLVVLRAMSMADGADHYGAPLIQAPDGFMYGASIYGGPAGGGTVFRLNPDGTGYTNLYSLPTSGNYSPRALVLSRDGRLYGAMSLGHAFFTLNRDGSGFAIIKTLAISAEGTAPIRMIEGSDGRLYGGALSSGAGGAGTIFRMNRDGTGYTVLRALSSASDGREPGPGLTEGIDGRFYGATTFGGAHDMGTIFRLNADGGGFTVLRHIASNEGARPYGKLIMASDGRLYGLGFWGGTAGTGAIFRMNLDGTGYTVLHSLTTGVEGGYTTAGLMQARDGAFYGVTPSAGLGGSGVIFRYDPIANAASVLASFNRFVHGNSTNMTLMQAADGRLYGMTRSGGANDQGTLYAYSIAPRLTSATTATATVGQPFSYRLTATLSPTSFAASNVPPGLTFNTATGELAGTPTQAATFNVTVGAANANGTTTGRLTLAIAQGTASIGFSNLNQAFDGTPKSPTITVTPAGLPLTVTYNGSSTPPSNAGTYTVVATVNDANYTGTASATMTIALQPAVIASQTAAPTVLAGTTTTLSVTATGSPPLTYRWQRRPSGGMTFVDLADGDGFAGTSTASLVITQPGLALNGDEFRVVITNGSGATTGVAIPLTVLPASRLRNVSIRASITPGEPLVVGFVANPSVSPLLVRAIGPGLAPFIGGAATLAGNPSLAIYTTGTTPIAVNDDWAGGTALATAFANVGAFPLPPTSPDAALLFDLNQASTAQMRVTSTGIGLVEIYDPTNDPLRRVVNLSARHHVGAGANALVAGFVISGTGTKTLLVRGIGPALRTFGVTDALNDARLDLFDAAAVRVNANDDWPLDLAATFAQAGAFALLPGSKDSAMVVTVPTGAYTVQLSSGDGAEGQGLIEVYELLR